jgi:hypothetical protein
MVGLPHLGALPIPAAGFQVTEGLFLPVAQGVVEYAQAGVIGNEAPGCILSEVLKNKA